MTDGEKDLKALGSFAGLAVHCIVDQLRVVAELLQRSDRRQHTGGLLPSQEASGRVGRQEVVVQFCLQVCQFAAHDFDDLQAENLIVIALQVCVQ